MKGDSIRPTPDEFLKQFETLLPGAEALPTHPLRIPHVRRPRPPERKNPIFRRLKLYIAPRAQTRGRSFHDAIHYDRLLARFRICSQDTT